MEVYNNSEETEELGLQLNDSAKGFLKEIAKWAYFLSILGYVGVGFIVLVAFFAGAFFAFIGNLTRETHKLGRVIYICHLFYYCSYLFLPNIFFE